MSAPNPYTSSPTTNFVVNSGVLNVDPFLAGVKWGGSGVGTAATIYYSFPVSNSTALWDQGSGAYFYGPGYEIYSGFKPLNFIHQIYATVALQSWANVANINIIKVTPETSSAVGDIRVAFTTDGLMDPGDFAYTYLPGPSFGGDLWLNTVQPVSTGNNFNVGGFGYQTLVHELGHALGLTHPFEGVSPLSTTLDNFRYTQMSYSDSPGHQDGGFSNYYPSTPMLLDIQAVQYLYGANMSYHAGNDTYVYNGTTINYETIWDAGGIDTIVYNSTTGGVINLNAGSFSVLGSPVSLDNGTLQYDNVAIAYNVTIENATGGSGNDSLIGNSVNNSLLGGIGIDNLTGNAGNDTLDGGAGNDVLNGGEDGDLYVVSDATNKLQAEINDTGLSGIDELRFTSVLAGTTLTLHAGDIGLETVVIGTGLAAVADIAGTVALNVNASAALNALTIIGNAGANSIVSGTGNDTLGGGAGADILIGGAGADILNGGAGADLLNGGEGGDLYIVGESADKPQAEINDTGLYGIDELRFAPAFAGTLIVHAGDTGLERIVIGSGLGAVADITGTVALNVNASAAINAFTITGNAGANSIMGGAGNDLLWGDAGNDTLIGGEGNDSLRSGLGSDVLDGGNGDDAYAIDVSTDIILADSSGIDTVNVYYATGTYTLAADLEHITLFGTGNIGGTGNALNNVITGNAGNNSIDGGAGNDLLWGDAGNDTLIGGDGNDSLRSGLGSDVLDGGNGDDAYAIDVSTDIILADSSGIDTVNVYYATGTYTLAADLEHITLFGTAAINGTGNALNNVITGNAGNNSIDGGAGNDLLWGDAGNDTLIGGDGNDSLRSGLGSDVLDGGNGDDAYAIDVSTDIILADSSGIDTVNVYYATGTYTLAADLEHITLFGTAAINGIGNALNNVITGNTGNNSIDGGAGNDLLWGDAGNDTLIGGDGNDSLRSGLGSDVLDGGNGDDAYAIDVSTDIILADSSGIDTVNVYYATGTYTLAADLEHITLFGTAAINGIGNALNNVITGNTAANFLAGGAGDDSLYGGDGNDTLTGGAGADILNGGEGGDLYAVGDATYKPQAEINDTGLSGIDELRFASVLAGTTLTVHAGDTGLETVVIGTGLAAVADITGTVALNVNASAALNALTITGNAGANSIMGGAGNDLIFGDAGNDTLIGGDGNDSLRSGLGSDVLDGGNGDDAYAIDVSTDIILADSGGIDTVNVYYATGTYTLAADLEHITLFGTAAINGIGNALNNVITGNAAANFLAGGAGDDSLYGGDGNDTLTGGPGADIFDFNAFTESLVGAARDIITDFSQVQLDKIDLSTIDANTTLANDQAFLATILNSGAFTEIGQLRLIGDILSGNSDSDFSTSEFEVQLTGVTSLISTDFYL